MRKPNPDLQRIDYSISHRKTYRESGLVYSIDSVRLTDEWRTKMEQILEIWDLPLFVKFIDDGYVTKFLDGTDLHGNKPFSRTESSAQSIVSDIHRAKVASIYEKAGEVGSKLGFTLGDITCGNMLMQGSDVFLIDYEVITEYPLSKAYENLWRNTKKIVFGNFF